MKKRLIASKILSLLTVVMCISLGCRKDRDEPEPTNSTSCKIETVSGGHYVYDQFGRLKNDGRNIYIYDSEGYLTTMKFDYPELYDESYKDETAHEYENGLLVKTSRISGFELSLIVQDFQYDNNKKLIGIIRNIYRINSSSPISTFTYTFKDEKIVSYVETIKGKTATPHEFKNGKLVKSIIEDGYYEYEYDDFGRLTKRTTIYKGLFSIIKYSYQEGKSYHRSIPKFKGFPEVINNWRQGSRYSPVPEAYEIFDLYYLFKDISFFEIKDGKEVEQRRTTFLYKLNKRDFPTSLETNYFYRDNKGVWTDDPNNSTEYFTFTYIDCE